MPGLVGFYSPKGSDHSKRFITELAYALEPVRPWVEDILLDQRTLERGYFQADAIRRLVNTHIAGKNLAIRIGALISLELALRQFVDR